MKKRKKIIESISVISILSFFLFMLITTYVSIEEKYKEFDKELESIKEKEISEKKEEVKGQVMNLVNYTNNKIDTRDKRAEKELREKMVIIQKLMENNAQNIIKSENFFASDIKVSFFSEEKDRDSLGFGFDFNLKKYIYTEYMENLGKYIKLELSEEDLIAEEKEEILEYINNIGLGGTDKVEDKYIFIITYDGVALVNSTLSEEIGKSIKDLKTSDGKYIHNDFYKMIITNPVGGFVKYNWMKPSLNKDIEKISFVYGIGSLKWIIGSGIYLDEINNKIFSLERILKNQIEKEIKKALLIGIIFLIFYLVFLKFISMYLYKDFNSFKIFFEEAIIYNKEISKEKIEFDEFFLLADYANKMLEDKKKLESQLVDLASRDELTGLSNRREFIKKLDEYYRRSIYGSEVSVMMLDLDYFKKINDTYGHEVGDKVLEEFAKLVKGIIRTDDIFGRIGGEEFAIILPRTNLVTAKIIGERIVDIVSKSILAEKITVTVSIGISYAKNKSFESSIQFLNNADENLYKAKNNGRNQVYV